MSQVQEHSCTYPGNTPVLCIKTESYNFLGQIRWPKKNKMRNKQGIIEQSKTITIKKRLVASEGRAGSRRATESTDLEMLACIVSIKMCETADNLTTCCNSQKGRKMALHSPPDIFLNLLGPFEKPHCKLEVLSFVRGVLFESRSLQNSLGVWYLT